MYPMQMNGMGRSFFGTEGEVMNRKLQNIAQRLSENDIHELLRLKKMGDKKVVALQKKRDKLAADLAKAEAQLAKLLGDAPAKPRRGRKPGTKKAAAPAAGRKKRKSSRVNLSAAVREVFARAGAPLRAREVVDALPDVGVKVKDVTDMRKRVSVVLASQKSYFEQVERGVYQLKG